jgi:hypothetical protein
MSPVHPLVPGTQVGAWRVKAWQGQGAYGAVYRAERVGFRRSGPVALKVSLSRWGWRMEREVELLSRLSHPSIPRLLDRGGPSSGQQYPYYLYALGVTAYRLVMGQYPGRMEARGMSRATGRCRALSSGRCWRAPARSSRG